MTVVVADITKAHFYHSEYGLIDRRQLLITFPAGNPVESDIWSGGGFDFYFSVGGALSGERTGYIPYDSFNARFDQDNASSALFLANVVGSDEGAGGWNAQITPNLTFANVGYYSLSYYFSLTIPQDAQYDIATNETITITIPSSLLTSGLGPLTASFTITEDG